ncbi:methyl-accepting chemotaxis protein [Schauerella aestuarii]|uniref:methyl-accepting chemotaxis protein n=1 Tax=Schauerella aestuarii TaxID=2511204 RepID=UPI0013691440|nr:methyl-accepting chemotaxis protein [Achromobacter aestuarii]MYZ45604.1 methyl-accepting chemotaxis protein [Achromobacter aestuarii]
MNQLKVVTRLAMGFGTLLLLVLLIAGMGLFGLSSVRESLREITEVNNVQGRLSSQMLESVMDRGIALRNIVLMTDPALVRAETDRIARQEKSYAAAYTELGRTFVESTSTVQKERDLYTRLKSEEAATIPAMAQVMRLGSSNDVAGAMKMLIEDVRPKQAAWLTSLRELVNVETQLNNEAAQAAGADYDRTLTMTLSMVALALLLGVLAAFLITRSILRQLGGEPHAAQISAGEIANGNLTVKMRVATGDSSSLMASLEAMRLQLSNVVSGIQSSAESISSASSQIAQGNVDLSQRTEEQAASLEETAASIEQLTSAVKQNTESAQQGSTLAASASETASAGGQVMGRVVTTMQDIKTSSARVADIISVIESIAFQTNILALNAAVEAARAGEQGRGFAVVASEVRTLAQRSATAAKEIKQLIETSVQHVSSGSVLVSEAGQTMEEVVRSVRRVTDIMGEIASASSEQSTGIEQVNIAVSQMDSVTQQNAALVEEAAAAAQSMSEQASSLLQAVAQFRVDGQPRGRDVEYAPGSRARLLPA